MSRGALIFLESIVPRDNSSLLDDSNDKQQAAVDALEGAEHQLDVELRKQDGWISGTRDHQCRHSVGDRCNLCEDIPPWRVMTLPKFEALNLKHLTFHAWLRQKEYNNLNNTVLLDDPCCYADIERGRAAMMNRYQSSIVLERQPYRHVDHVCFESPEVVDHFIGVWRSTGLQRFGFLIGKYVADSTIPLGVRAIVCAIYEPPQTSTADRVYLNSDEVSEKIDALAASLGLERVGCIWTRLRTDAQRRVIFAEEPALTNIEMYRSARLQNRYAARNRQSSSGKFGSKFVSIVVHANEDLSVGISAYQVSNQYSALIRDGVVKPSKLKADLLKVKPSTQTRLHPEILYFHRNEYNIDVQCRASPTFPVEYGVVSLSHSTPKLPDPFFLCHTFSPQQVGDYKQHISRHVQSNYPACLRDWQFIVFMALNSPTLLEQHVLPIINGSQSELDSTKHLLQNLASPSFSKYQSMIDSMTSMGYSYEIAKSTLEAVEYSSIENALGIMFNE